MNRTPIFDCVRVMLGRGFTDVEVRKLDKAIDASIGVPAAVPGHRRINKAGLELIKSFEGLRLKAYPDPATGGHPWTVGYGSTGAHVRPGVVLTEAQAETLLQEDLARFEKAVEKAAPKSTDNQFAAMVSLAFNVGETAFEGSTLARKHNAGDYAGAADQFRRWNRAAGRVMAGLSRRRAAEAALYRTP